MATKGVKKTINLKQVETLAALGLTDVEIGSILDVNESTINEWKSDPAFDQALKKGKLQADSKVVQSLYRRALGYEVTETTMEPERGTGPLVVSKTVTKHIAPDIMACMYWLNNRRKADWRYRTTVEHEGKVDLNGKVLTAKEEDQLIRDAVKRHGKELASILGEVGIDVPAGRKNGKGALAK